MSFAIYLSGFLLVIGGLIYGAVQLHVPMEWIITGAIVLTGIALIMGVKATREKDPHA